MALASLKDLYFDELADLYDAETQMLRTLPRLVEAARSPDLREALKKHYDESRLHLERLELIFTHWGERRRAKPCAGLSGIVQEADERLNQATTEDARDAAIIGVAQRMEHYEIAAYGCARTYARRLNRLDEARLLQETLDEEGRADRHLTELAEAHINDDARFETDFAAPPRPVRLRYVPMHIVAQRRGRSEPLAVLNDAGDRLGVLDGLVAEHDLGAVRYAVVDVGGLIHRRYLLPLRLMWLDTRASALRIAIDTEVAHRYPAFDAGEFEAMSDAAMRVYEERLLTFFPRQRRTRLPEDLVGELPEWLLKATWITVPPPDAERLPDEARTFVNEFTPRAAEPMTPPDREQMVAREPAPETRPADWSSSSARRSDS